MVSANPCDVKYVLLHLDGDPSDGSRTPVNSFSTVVASLGLSFGRHILSFDESAESQYFVTICGAVWDAKVCWLLQVGLAQMLKGGVIMDVTTPEEARIAEEAGAVAVMALERVPADIRKEGGVARMSDAEVIQAIKKAVTIPVMAKARIGHFVEAQILEALEVDYIDESEVHFCILT